MTREQAQKAVDAILFDLRGRHSLRQAWDAGGVKIEDEIKKEWVRLILLAASKE